MASADFDRDNSGKPDLEGMLDIAIRTAQEGNRDSARVMFRRVLNEDRFNERAMLWLAKLAQTREERKEWLLWKRFQPKRGDCIEESRQVAESTTVPVSPVKPSAEHPVPSRSKVAVATAPTSPARPGELPAQYEWENAPAYWERVHGETASEFTRRLLQGGSNEQHVIRVLTIRYRLSPEAAQGIVDSEWDAV